MSAVGPSLMSLMHHQHQPLWHFIQRRNKMLSNPEAPLSACFEMTAFVLMFALLKQIFTHKSEQFA